MSTFGFGDAELDYSKSFSSAIGIANKQPLALNPTQNAEDFGYIQYQAQRDLERVRTRLDSIPQEQTVAHAEVTANLQLALKDVVARAEADLRVKAELVLKNVDDTRSKQLLDGTLGLGVIPGKHSSNSNNTNNTNNNMNSKNGKNYMNIQPHMNTHANMYSSNTTTKKRPVLAGTVIREEREQRWSSLPQTANGLEFVASTYGLDVMKPKTRATQKRKEGKRMNGFSLQGTGVSGVSSLINAGKQPSYIDTSGAFHGIDPNSSVHIPLTGQSIQMHLPHTKHMQTTIASEDVQTNLKISLPSTSLYQETEQVSNAPNIAMLRSYHLTSEQETLDTLAKPLAHTIQALELHNNSHKTNEYKQARSHAEMIAEDQSKKSVSHAQGNFVNDTTNSLIVLPSNIPGYLSQLAETKDEMTVETQEDTLEHALQTYSLHTLTLRGGFVVREGADWRSFLRCARQVSSSVEEVLRVIEMFCRTHKILTGIVSGESIVNLAKDMRFIRSLSAIHSISNGMLFGGRVAECLLHCILKCDVDLSKVIQATDLSKVAFHSSQPQTGVYGLIAGQKITYTGVMTPLVRVAAIRVLSVLQMTKCRKAYLAVRNRQRAAIRLQRVWRRYSALKRIRETAKDKWALKQEQWTQKCERMEISNSGPRLLIHCASISVDSAQLMRRSKVRPQHGIQLARLYDLLDPDVEMIYLTPTPLVSSVKRFWQKLLCAAAKARYGDNLPPALTSEGFSARLKQVSPDPDLGMVEIFIPNTHPPVTTRVCVYPPHLSLSTKLQYSPHVLKRLQNLVKGYNAVLIPGQQGQEDIKLAVELGIPLSCATAPAILDGSLTQLSSKQGTNNCFLEAGLLDIPEEYGHAHTLLGLCRTLSQLIVHNPSITQCIVKLENETHGRGIMFVNMLTLTSVSKIRNERQQQKQRWKLQETKLNACERVLSELLGCFSFITAETKNHTSVIHPSTLYTAPQSVSELFNDDKLLHAPQPVAPPSATFQLVDLAYWGSINSYIHALTKQGAVVEKFVPHVLETVQVPVYISNNGSVDILGSADVQFGQKHQRLGLSVPSTAPTSLISTTSRFLGRILRSKGIRGAITIKYLLYQRETQASSIHEAYGNTLVQHPLKINIGYDDVHACMRLLKLASKCQSTSMSQLAHQQTPLNPSYVQYIQGLLPLHGDWQLLTTTQPGVYEPDARQTLEVTTRHAIFLPFVAITGMEKFTEQILFTEARRAQLTFDMPKALGCLLLLIDSITSGALMTLTLGETPLQTVTNAKALLHFLLKQAHSSGDKNAEPYRRLVGMLDQRINRLQQQQEQ